MVVVGVEAVSGSIACVAIDADRNVLGRHTCQTQQQWDLMTAAQADAAAIELHSALNALFALTASQPTANLWQSIEAVCIGTTAADLGEESESNIRTAVRRLLPSSVQVLVYNSAAIALVSGTGGPLLGCVLVAGIDSSRAYGAVADRRTAAASGWGPVFSDGGCAYDIGLRVLSAISRAQDGRGADTLLVNAVYRHLGAQRAEDLIRWARSHQSIHQRVSGVASLARLVLDCASRGDSVADALLRHAVGELLRAIKAVVAKLGLDRSRQPFNLVLAGPMLSDGTLFMQYLLEALKDGVPTADVIYPLGDAAEAAAWLALWLLNPRNPTPPLRRGL
ncbi:hypothetical protein Vretimale_5717 [Volvox reticuliferus]|uniref:N-acetyl-D-glucosamine kinase n=1 Tax=Volvox reticuliferus TaxID=1737510 RepID=A0A8J4LLE3_9CHLO|nr:hypothetical protein Vretifemale_5847 [Volvox reticuliferus]GIM00843.1 hypothetical protein Vretimale_5717 [Volvox reticuliferus]